LQSLSGAVERFIKKEKALKQEPIRVVGSSSCRRSLERRRAKERDMPVFLTAPKDLQRTPAYDELLRVLTAGFSERDPHRMMHMRDP
jgi:hypothetical protein